MNRKEKIEALNAVFTGRADVSVLYKAIPIDLSIYSVDELKFLLRIKIEKRAIQDFTEKEKEEFDALVKKQVDRRQTNIKLKRRS